MSHKILLEFICSKMLQSIEMQERITRDARFIIISNLIIMFDFQ